MENGSGMRPIEHKILVLPEQVSEKTAGGLIKPEDVRYNEELAQTDGVLVAAGEMAFKEFWGNGQGYKPWPCEIPKVGQKIKFGKYSGIVLDGLDGNRYRLINDRDVLAIIGG